MGLKSWHDLYCWLSAEEGEVEFAVKLEEPFSEGSDVPPEATTGEWFAVPFWVLDPDDGADDVGEGAVLLRGDDTVAL